MGFKVAGTGHYVPSDVITNEQLASIMDTNNEWIVSHTGINTRHISLKGENTSDLATNTAKIAIQKAGIDASDIDLIIVSTITADNLTPATAAIVQRNIGATKAWAYDISTACSGFVFAMSTADKFLSSGQYKTALIISAEVNSKMMDFKDRTSTVFFGDGAGAAILIADDYKTLKAEDLNTNGDDQAIHSGHTNPLTEISATNYPSNDAFFQDGRKVFEFATNVVPKHMLDFLRGQDLTPDDIDYFIVHQANLRIIEAIAKFINQPMEKFVVNVNEYGNTSSAGIAMGFDQLNSRVDLSGKRLMLTGFGAGISYGSLLLEINDAN
ncbi:MAG: ketoacyl-ACP synthase III [Lactobacillaceae bacterium]|jgi:3-oxoacyl-[acyl-carrier-protein] synthase-3|nr:ketoacyl-ACP synthase III [Lactobacillaceae bacterium]